MAGITNHRGGVKDVDNELRDGVTNLTADELNQAFTLAMGVPLMKPLAMYVLVPQKSTSDSLKVTVRCLTTGEKIEVTHTDEFDDSTAAAPFIFCLPLPPSRGTSWEYDLNVTGSAVNFGGVQVWIGLVDNAKVDA